jgi:hypothetical protein
VSNTKEKIDEIDAVVPEPSSVQIESLEHMYLIIQGWHQHKMEILTHMVEIPEGTTFQKGDETPQTLAGEYLLGFKAGVSAALIEVSEFPLLITHPEDAPSVEDESA